MYISITGLSMLAHLPVDYSYQLIREHVIDLIVIDRCSIAEPEKGNVVQVIAFVVLNVHMALPASHARRPELETVAHVDKVLSTPSPKCAGIDGLDLRENRLGYGHWQVPDINTIRLLYGLLARIQP